MIMILGLSIQKQVREKLGTAECKDDLPTLREASYIPNPSPQGEGS
jgi:hypothetical protein